MTTLTTIFETTRADADGTITVPGAPRIPGLRFRAYRGPADHPEMVRVCNTAHTADCDPEVMTVERMTSDYANLTNSDPFRDVLIAEVAGTMVAYSRVYWRDVNHGERSYDSFGFVDPAWRRRGLGRAMLRRNLHALRAIAAGHVTDRPRNFGTWSEDTDLGAVALLAAEGFLRVRRFSLMVRPDLEAGDIPPLPPGLEVRPVTESQLRAIFDADNEAFLDHFGAVDPSEESFRRWTGDPDFDPGLLVIAWDGDEVAGGVLNSIDRAENVANGYARGWLASVFTRRPWRQRGLARALIGRSLVLLRDRGMTSAQLGVDVDNANQALRLYEETGFRVASSASAYRRDWD